MLELIPLGNGPKGVDVIRLDVGTQEADVIRLDVGIQGEVVIRLDVYRKHPKLVKHVKIKLAMASYNFRKPYKAFSLLLN